MAKAIGYTRVSTDEQGASGLGLEAQDASIRVMAARSGFEVSEVHTDAGLIPRIGLQIAVAQRVADLGPPSPISRLWRWKL